jgi:hypothetical protein
MEINTLITDIYSFIQRKEHDWLVQVGQTLAQRSEIIEPRRPTLRLSQLGPKCPCALWHSIHKPELAEELPAYAQFKYSYGHIIEASAIALAKLSGHHVCGEQDELTVDGIVGHRDCIIDGCVVDVKSASSFSYAKFRDKSIRDNDPFGYLEQLDAYLLGSVGDDLVTVKDRAYLLAIDKQLGHMCLYEHQLRAQHIRSRISAYKDIVSLDTPPVCECGTVPDGKSGNIRLDTKASYNIYKHTCFPNLRTFLYASGPVYLTKVVRKPDVPEVDKFGQLVYN